MSEKIKKIDEQIKLAKASEATYKAKMTQAKYEQVLGNQIPRDQVLKALKHLRLYVCGPCSEIIEKAIENVKTYGSNKEKSP